MTDARYDRARSLAMQGFSPTVIAKSCGLPMKEVIELVVVRPPQPKPWRDLRGGRPAGYRSAWKRVLR